MDRIYKIALISLVINIAYAIYHIAMGCVAFSWWLLTVGTYYVGLSVMRYAVLSSQEERVSSIKLVAGILLMVMALPLAGTVILAALRDRGNVFDEITMITIAVYTFAKIIIASVNIAKSGRFASEKVRILRNISFADALVSILSLQRSMLVSFGAMPPDIIRLMNIATGAVVCILVFLLGANLLRKRKAPMPQLQSQCGEDRVPQEDQEQNK